MTGLGGLLVALTASAVVLLAVAVAGALVTRRLWQLPALAPTGALLGLGVAGTTTFYAYVLSTAAGTATAVVVVAGSAVVCAAAAARRPRTASPIRTVAPWALLVAGSMVATTGILALWDHPGTWFDLARTRFLNPLPDDNEIPARVAEALFSGLDPRTAPGGDWRSSDRPPLQTGVLLLVRAVTDWSGIDPSTGYFAAGMAVQFSWIPAAASVLSMLGARPRTAALGILFTSLSGTVLVNTTFTWPKLVSAALALAALAVLLSLPRQQGVAGPLTAAGLLCAFAALAHGAAVFAAPVLLWALWGARRRFTWVGVGTAAAAAIAGYLPWLLYQRLFDPPGDRLLKWHLAGVEQPTSESLGAVLSRAYGGASWRELLTNKLSNLTAPFSRWPWAGLGDVLGDPTDRRISEFFVLTSAIGVGAVLLVAMGGAWVAGAVRGGPPDGLLHRASAAMVAVVAALVFWALVLFGPNATSVHQGSHVPVLLLLLLPSSWLAQRARWAVVAATVVQAVAVLVTYAETGASGEDHISTAALVLGTSGLALCVAGAVAVRNPPAPGPTARPAPAAHGPDAAASPTAETHALLRGRGHLPPVPEPVPRRTATGPPRVR